MKKNPTLMMALVQTALLAENCYEGAYKQDFRLPRDALCSNCYTLNFYEKNCENNLFIEGDFLYWYSSENELIYATLVKTIANIYSPEVVVNLLEQSTLPVKEEIFKAKWQPSFRIGLGSHLSDGWDISACWTYFDTKKTASIEVTPFNTQFPALGQYGISLPWLDNALLLQPPTTFQSTSAKWLFRINMIDLEIGRKYFLSPCFTMRPYLGLRGSLTDTTFQVNGLSNQNVTQLNDFINPPVFFAIGDYTLTTSDQFKNHNQGIGPVVGFQPSFWLNEKLSIYANADVALLWERFSNKNVRSYEALYNTTTVAMELTTPTASNHFWGIQPIVDLALGLCWQAFSQSEAYYFEIDAGWEHHIWFEHNYRVKLYDPDIVPISYGFTTSSSGSNNLKYAEQAFNLVMGGLIVRARLDF